MNILNHIKHLVIGRKIIFTKKARCEMVQDNLNQDMVIESIVYAPDIYKKIRSTNPKTQEREYLYIIKGLSLDGTLIYSKGKLEKNEKGVETFYVFISSKKSF